ncbi:MAG: hypothetical protein ACOY7P_06085 [Pseudomonadota bacterium]
MARTIMLAFSAFGNTEAREVRRRMSLPDAGLAMMPTLTGWEELGDTTMRLLNEV